MYNQQFIMPCKTIYNVALLYLTDSCLIFISHKDNLIGMVFTTINTEKVKFERKWHKQECM